MPIKKAARNYLIRTYGGLYSRFMGEDAGDCFYCGALRSCLDHSPPISAFEYVDAKFFKTRQIPLVLVPCCSQCNVYLGDRKLFTVQERLEFLEMKYEKEFARVANLWTDEEIDEMGFSFQKVLRVKQEAQYELARKVRSVQTRAARSWTHPEFQSLNDNEGDIA
jgi:hypothetical protein